MPRPNYVLLKQIINEIKTAGRRQPVKLAITISGGGARGAYEAGAVEAILQALIQSGIRPSILAGTSAGALIATGLFMDLLYTPLNPPSGIYFGQQSLLWRKLADGNTGADQIAGDRAEILKWLTHEIPFDPLATFTAMSSKASVTEGAINAMVADLQRLGRDWLALFQTVNSFNVSLTSTAILVNQATKSFRDDCTKLADDFTKKDMVAFWADFGKTLVDAVTGSLATPILVMLGVVADLTVALTAFLKTLGAAALAVGADVAAFVTDKGRVVGSAAQVLTSSIDFAASIRALLNGIQKLAFVPDGSGGSTLTDRVLQSTLLRDVLAGFMRQVFVSSGRPVAAGADVQQLILDDWLMRTRSGEALPELFLTGSDITSSRLGVFCVAGVPSIAAIAAREIWAVDLMRVAPRTQYVMQPRGLEGNRFIVDAAVTSAAIPMAFPPQKWDVDAGPFGGLSNRVKHTFVDGGVLDGSPIDICAIAGATHILSLELTPLIDQTSLTIDDRRGNLGTIAWDSFTTAMDGNLRRSIDALVANNTNERVQIFRLAPLIPAIDAQQNSRSPGVFDFDGVFDTNHQRQTSLYDWFMQGYIDAKGLTATTVGKDLVVLDYLVGVLPSARGYVGNAKPGVSGVALNKFWRASTQAWPDALP